MHQRHPKSHERPKNTATTADPAAHESAAALAELLDGYLADLQQGRRPQREKLLAEHPELASQLEQCLSGIEFIHRASLAPTGVPERLGDFRIIREVGRGGMGVVYEAEQLSLKRRVALKVLRLPTLADSESMQRFQREAETVAGLEHPGIVPIFAVGCEDGVHYYAMQLIEGRSLAEEAEEETRKAVEAEPRRCAAWCLQAAEALAYAHERGVVHRDVKPSNLIRDAAGRIWLTDFGLSKRQADVTLSMTGALLGTPRYMSPEQASPGRRPLDHRTDIYSLGATLYELCTRKPLFDGESPDQVLAQILTVEPALPRGIQPAIPTDLETIIVKCLAKDPTQRYATAQDLADDLRAFLDNRPIKARRPTLLDRAARWAHRHRRTTTAAGISAAASIFLIVCLVFGTRYYREARLTRWEFTTEGPPLVGQLRDPSRAAEAATGDVAVANFPVPTSEPLPLGAGRDYELTLASSGLLSQSWPLRAEPGVPRKQTVRLEAGWLWPPRELNDAELPHLEIVRGATHDDIVIVRQRVIDDRGRATPTLQRIDGRSGRPAWPQSFTVAPDNAPPGRDPDEWAQLLSPSFALPEDRQLARPLPDLDGDGVGDLVWAARRSASLLAVSGRDGHLLWWFRSEPPRPAADGPTLTLQREGPSCVVGQAAVIDVDRDDVADLVACMQRDATVWRDDQGQPRQVKAGTWLEAVSGSTGQSLWRCPLPVSLSEYRYGSETAARYTSLQPRQITIGGRAALVIVVGNFVCGVEPSSGQPLWAPHALPSEPIADADWNDLDGDGDSELLLLNDVPGDPGAVELSVHGSGDWSRRWRAEFRPTYDGRRPEQLAPPSYLVQDLDGDGTSEVALLTGGPKTTIVGRPIPMGCDLLDGATGSLLWQYRVPSLGGSFTPRLEGLLAGPDLDGDGNGELFAIWRDSEQYGSGAWLFAAAVCGKSGRPLWRRRLEIDASHRTPDRSGPPDWWQPDAEGRPLLMIPRAYVRGGQDETYFLNAGTGELAHRLPGVRDPRVADFNGDGLSDLLYTVAPQGASRLVAIGGTTPHAWKQLGTWQPVQDLDADGYDDFVQTGSRSLTARSGRDGEVIWHHEDGPEIETRDQELVSPALPEGDVDGDGIPDLFAFIRLAAPMPMSGSYQSVAAFSGRDGRQLWTAEDFGATPGGGSGSSRGYSYSYPSLDSNDLTGDGRADLLVYHASGTSPSGVSLTLLDGFRGKPLWTRNVASQSSGTRPALAGHAPCDMNGDGRLDLLAWLATKGTSSGASALRLQALDGTTGKTLWPEAPLELSEDSQLLWPHAAAADLDGDGSIEAVACIHKGYNAQRQRHELELAVIEGATGERQWSWGWDEGSEILPPLLVRSRAARTAPSDQGEEGEHAEGSAGTGHFVCLGLYQQGRPVILVWNAEGAIVGRLALDERTDLSVPLWQAADVDADGDQELLFAGGGMLQAARLPAGDVVWRTPLRQAPADQGYRGRSGAIVDILTSGIGKTPTVVLWTGNEVRGLDGPGGVTRWRCEVPWSPATGMSSPPTVVLVSAGDSQPPRVVSHWRQYAGDDWSTVARQAWLVDEDGRYRPPSAEPRQYAPVAALRPAGRPLPWSYHGPPDWQRTLYCLAVPSGLVSLVILVVPGWLALIAIRRRSWGAMLALTAYAAFFALGPWRQNVSSMLAMAVPLMMVVHAARGRRSTSFWLILLYVALILSPLAWFHLVSAHHETLARSHAWRTWWWLDESLVEPLLLALVGLPGFAFWWLAGRYIRRGQRRRLLLLLASLVLCTGILTAVLLLVDARRNAAAEQYATHGWFLVVFWGGYVAGLLAWLAEMLLSLRRRFFADRRSTLPETQVEQPA